MAALLFVIHQSDETASGLELRLVYEPRVLLTDSCIRLSYDPASIQLSNDDPDIVRKRPEEFIDKLLDYVITENVNHVVAAIEFHKRNNYADSKCKVFDPKKDKDIYNRVKEYRLDKLKYTRIYDPNPVYNKALKFYVNSNIDTFWGIKPKEKARRK